MDWTPYLPITQFKIKTALSPEGIRDKVAALTEKPIGLMDSYPDNYKPYAGFVDESGFKLCKLYTVRSKYGTFVRPEDFQIIGRILPDGIQLTMSVPISVSIVGIIFFCIFFPALVIMIISGFATSLERNLPVAFFFLSYIGYLLFLGFFRIRMRKVRSALEELFALKVPLTKAQKHTGLSPKAPIRT